MLVMTIFSAYMILLLMICRLLLRFVLRKKLQIITSKLFVKLTLLRWHQIESNPKLELYTLRPMCFLEKVWIWPIIFVVYCHPVDIQRYLWSAIRLMVCQPKFLQDVWNIFRVNILFQKKFLWATESDTILNFFLKFQFMVSFDFSGSRRYICTLPCITRLPFNSSCLKF